MRKYVLFGMTLTAAMKESRSGVLTPFTAVMKLVGGNPY